MITAPLLLVGGLATTSATTRASATSPPPMSTTAAGTRSWPKERRSQTGPYSNDGTTIGPAGSERRPPRCPLTIGPKSPKVADDVQATPRRWNRRLPTEPTLIICVRLRRGGASATRLRRYCHAPGPTTRSANVCAKQSTPSTSRGPLSVSRACWPKASRLSAFYWIGSSGYGRSAVKTHARRLPDQQPLRVHVQGDGLPARNVAPVEEVAHGRRP